MAPKLTNIIQPQLLCHMFINVDPASIKREEYLIHHWHRLIDNLGKINTFYLHNKVIKQQDLLQAHKNRQLLYSHFLQNGPVFEHLHILIDSHFALDKIQSARLLHHLVHPGDVLPHLDVVLVGKEFVYPELLPCDGSLPVAICEFLALEDNNIEQCVRPQANVLRFEEDFVLIND